MNNDYPPPLDLEDDKVPSLHKSVFIVKKSTQIHDNNSIIEMVLFATDKKSTAKGRARECFLIEEEYSDWGNVRETNYEELIIVCEDATVKFLIDEVEFID